VVAIAKHYSLAHGATLFELLPRTLRRRRFMKRWESSRAKIPSVSCGYAMTSLVSEYKRQLYPHIVIDNDFREGFLVYQRAS